MPRLPDTTWNWWWNALLNGSPYLIETTDHPHVPNVLTLQTKAYAQAKMRNAHVVTYRLDWSRMAVQAWARGIDHTRPLWRPQLRQLPEADMLPDPLVTRMAEQAAQEAAAHAAELADLEALCTCGVNPHGPSCRVWG